MNQIELPTDDEIEDTRRILRNRTPSVFFIPNVGQEKFFLPYKKVDSSGQLKVPYINLFGGGNGVGKSSAEMILLVGLIWGLDYLNPFFDDYDFFTLHQRMKAKRGRPGLYRIVCHSDHIKEGGPVYQNIVDWFPKDKYKLEKAGKTFYQQLICDNGDFVTIKTWDQDVLAQAGSTLDFIITDEPLPEELWDETVGRTRAGGKIAMGMTALELSGWVMDKIVDDADGSRIVVSNAMVWDNCADWHPDDAMWSGGKVGQGTVLTRGRLFKEDIDNMIREWEKSDALSVDARVFGTFTHLSGAIYKVYSNSTHVVPEFEIQPEWPIYCIMDPHDAKPPAILWVVQTPTRFYGWKEWPTQEYTSLSHTSLTVAEVSEIIRGVEGDRKNQVVYRYMDPNYGIKPIHTTQVTIQQEYAKNGFRFDCNVIDDLSMGHERVSQLLWYDWRRPFDYESNSPLLTLFPHMQNTQKALGRYGFKRRSEKLHSMASKIDPKYKDFADCVRYFAMKRKIYAPVSSSNGYMARAYSSRVMKTR